MQAHHIDPLTGEDDAALGLPTAGDGAHARGCTTCRSIPTIPATWGKVQRNAPCPCGSGRKYKHCHGALV